MVVGRAAILINPRDREQLANALHRVLTDRVLRESMIKAGSERVTRFNWYRVARGVLSVYYEVHKRTEYEPLTVQSFIPMTVWRGLKKIEEFKIAIIDERKFRGLASANEN